MRDDNAPGDDNAPKKQIPRPPPDVAVPAPGEPDDGALEARQIGSGRPARDLKKEAEEAEHTRTEKFRNHFEIVAIVALWTLFLAMGAIGAVWILQLVTPVGAPCHWLTDPQIEKLQDILTGGIIAGLVADHFKRRMEHH